MDKIEIICIESDAFYKLLEEVIRRFAKSEQKNPEKWISGPEAMRMLRITSKTTLQKMRGEGRIRFTQLDKKIILYDVDSIKDYLGDFVYEPFNHTSGKGKKLNK
jgi:hypothetical protein